jgi:hypothetical protein
MRRDVPKRYQALYARAMRGKSRKAAIHSFCAECVGYVVKEIHLCTDAGCPLFPYRPRATAPPAMRNAAQNGKTSTKSPKAGKCTPGIPTAKMGELISRVPPQEHGEVLGKIQTKPKSDGSPRGTFGGREKSLPSGIDKRESYEAQQLSKHQETGYSVSGALAFGPCGESWSEIILTFLRKFGFCACNNRRTW